MNKQQLYESIMANVAKLVKKTLNESDNNYKLSMFSEYFKTLDNIIEELQTSLDPKKYSMLYRSLKSQIAYMKNMLDNILTTADPRFVELMEAAIEELIEENINDIWEAEYTYKSYDDTLKRYDNELNGWVVEIDNVNFYKAYLFHQGYNDTWVGGYFNEYFNRDYYDELCNIDSEKADQYEKECMHKYKNAVYEEHPVEIRCINKKLAGTIIFSIKYNKKLFEKLANCITTNLKKSDKTESYLLPIIKK